MLRHFKCLVIEFMSFCEPFKKVLQRAKLLTLFTTYNIFQ